MIVSDIVKQLQKLPQHKSIICQVVGQNSGTWNMEFEFSNIAPSWMVQLRVFHKDLPHLDMDWTKTVSDKSESLSERDQILEEVLGAIEGREQNAFSIVSSMMEDSTDE